MEHIIGSIEYLDQAEENLPNYLEKIEQDLPRRINKEDCIDIFTKYGLYRSYTLRE